MKLMDDAAKRDIEHGAQFPFDALDTWWDGDGVTPPPATDWAHAAARGIIANLQGRGGVGNELERGNIDEETRAEIIKSIAAIIRAAQAGA